MHCSLFSTQELTTLIFTMSYVTDQAIGLEMTCSDLTGMILLKVDEGWSYKSISCWQVCVLWYIFFHAYVKVLDRLQEQFFKDINANAVVMEILHNSIVPLSFPQGIHDNALLDQPHPSSLRSACNSPTPCWHTFWLAFSAALCATRGCQGETW